MPWARAGVAVGSGEPAAGVLDPVQRRGFRRRPQRVLHLVGHAGAVVLHAGVHDGIEPRPPVLRDRPAAHRRGRWRSARRRAPPAPRRHWRPRSSSSDRRASRRERCRPRRESRWDRGAPAPSGRTGCSATTRLVALVVARSAPVRFWLATLSPLGCLAAAELAQAGGGFAAKVPENLKLFGNCRPDCRDRSRAFDQRRDPACALRR